MAGPARPPLTSGAGELRAVDPGHLFGVGTRRIERLAGRMGDVEALRARLAAAREERAKVMALKERGAA